MRATAETPGRLAQAVLPGKAKEEPQLELLLADLIRYSDLVVFRIDEASRDYERILATPEAELQAARWRLDSLRWATQLAAGANSISGLLDLVSYSTVFGWMVADQWIPKVGAAVEPLQKALEHTRDDGWLLVERYLPAADVKAARDLMDVWRLEHERIDRDLLLMFPSFTSLAEEKSGNSGSSNLLGMVGLDPLSGLEPAARQIEETRQFGQRVLYFLQRAPRLVAAESELRLLELRESQEVRQVLADTERITATLEEFSAITAALPAQVSQEREAAVAQIAAELGAQRAALLADLESSRAPLESLLGETRTTLAAGERMSSELTKTLEALDGFVGRFDGPADAAAPPSAPAAVPAPEGKPFDVSDYGAAAERVAHAAAELNALVVALDERLPEAQRLLDEAAARGNAAVDHAFRRALLLGLLLIAAAAGAFLLVRRLGRSALRPG